MYAIYVSTSRPCPVCQKTKDCRFLGNLIHCLRATRDDQAPAGYRFVGTSSLGWGMFAIDDTGIGAIGSIASGGHTDEFVDFDEFSFPVLTLEGVRRKDAKAAADAQVKVVADASGFSYAGPGQHQATSSEVSAATPKPSWDAAAHFARFPARLVPLDEPNLHYLANRLTLPPDVFSVLNVCYTDDTGLSPRRCRPGWVFPERDGLGHIVGYHIRQHVDLYANSSDAETEKRTVGTHGLFIPDAIATQLAFNADSPLFVVEGASDVLACAAMGLFAIGRPSDRGGIAHLLTFLSRPDIAGPGSVNANRKIVIVGENDRKTYDWGTRWPGRDGAIHVADELSRRLGRVVHWSLPMAAFKDARDYLKWHQLNCEDGETTLAALGEEFGGWLIANATQSTASPRTTVVPAPSQPQTISIQPPIAVAAPSSHSTASSAVTAFLGDSSWCYDWGPLAKQPGEPDLRPSSQPSQPPIDDGLPHCCPNPKGVVQRHPETGQMRTVWFDCHRLCCQFCSIGKKRQYRDTVSHHIHERDDNDKFFAFRCTDRQWPSIRRRVRGRGGDFFCVATGHYDSDGNAILYVLASARPPKVIADADLAILSKHEAITACHAAIDRMATLVPKAFTSSRAWKLVTEIRIDSGFRVIGKFSEDPGTVCDILNWHSVPWGTIAKKGKYRSWMAIEWRDTDWEHIVNDIYVGMPSSKINVEKEVNSNIKGDVGGGVDWWGNPVETAVNTS